MGKAKGLSFDEKRIRLLQLFHDKKEVFNLKELEKLGPKKGIVEKTVKEVLESLVNDDLVETDKIGSANFFWSLPSKTTQILSTKLAQTKQQIDLTDSNILNLQIETEMSTQGRQDSEERNELIKKMNLLKQIQENNLNELKIFNKNDPQRLIILQNLINQTRININIISDNIQTIKNYLKKINPILNDYQLNEAFNIPEDMDYV